MDITRKMDKDILKDFNKLVGENINERGRMVYTKCPHCDYAGETEGKCPECGKEMDEDIFTPISDAEAEERNPTKITRKMLENWAGTDVIIDMFVEVMNGEGWSIDDVKRDALNYWKDCKKRKNKEIEKNERM